MTATQNGNGNGNGHHKTTLSELLKRASLPADQTLAADPGLRERVEKGMHAYHETITKLERELRDATEGWRGEYDAHDATRRAHGQDLERSQTERAMLESQLADAHAKLQDVAATKAENTLLRSQLKEALDLSRDLDGKLSRAKVYMATFGAMVAEGIGKVMDDDLSVVGDDKVKIAGAGVPTVSLEDELRHIVGRANEGKA